MMVCVCVCVLEVHRLSIGSKIDAFVLLYGEILRRKMGKRKRLEEVEKSRRNGWRLGVWGWW